MRELVAAWPPTRHRVDRQRAQALGRGVHRSGQPRRSGTDDDDVVAALGQRVGRQPELEGEIAGRRPLEHTPRRDGDRQVGGVHAEAVEERGDVGVGVGIDPVVRQPVAGGVLAQRHRRRRELGPDDLQRVRSTRHQRRSAGEERLEDDIAQPGVGQHPRPEHLGRHHHDLARLRRPGSTGTGAAE